MDNSERWMAACEAAMVSGWEGSENFVCAPLPASFRIFAGFVRASAHGFRLKSKRFAHSFFGGRWAISSNVNWQLIRKNLISKKLA